MKRIVPVLAAVLMISGCNQGITDPDKDDDYDVDEGTGKIGQIDRLPTPTGTATTRPEACMFATIQGTPTKSCFKQSGPNVDDFVLVNCSNIYPEHRWIKAIGNSMDQPREVWVAVPEDDDNLTFQQTSGTGAGQWTYSPNLIHTNGTPTGHRQCNFAVEMLETCPGPSNYGCVTVSQNVTGNSKAEFE